MMHTLNIVELIWPCLLSLHTITVLPLTTCTLSVKYTVLYHSFIFHIQDGTILEDVPPLSLIDAVTFDSYNGKGGLSIKGEGSVGGTKRTTHDNGGM